MTGFWAGARLARSTTGDVGGNVGSAGMVDVLGNLPCLQTGRTLTLMFAAAALFAGRRGRTGPWCGPGHERRRLAAGRPGSACCLCKRTWLCHLQQADRRSRAARQPDGGAKRPGRPDRLAERRRRQGGRARPTPRRGRPMGYGSGHGLGHRVRASGQGIGLGHRVRVSGQRC